MKHIIHLSSQPPAVFLKRILSTRSVPLQATGAQFPLVARFWEGDTAFRCIGAGVRSKKIGFIGVKVRHLEIERHSLAFNGGPASL